MCVEYVLGTRGNGYTVVRKKGVRHRSSAMTKIVCDADSLGVQAADKGGGDRQPDVSQ